MRRWEDGGGYEDGDGMYEVYELISVFGDVFIMTGMIIGEITNCFLKVGEALQMHASPYLSKWIQRHKSAQGSNLLFINR